MSNLLGGFGFSVMKHEPLSKTVARALQTAIIHGQLLPGTRLIEENIAAELGISRVPVREALRSLEKFGFVVIESGMGARVKILSVKDVEEIYGVRAVIEGYALDLCIQSALDQTIERLQEHIRHANEITRSQQTNHFELVDFDIQFDDILCSMSGNTKVDEIWQLLRPTIQWVFAINPYYEQGVWNGSVSHQSIVDALRQKDYPAAQDLLREHIQASEQSTLSAFRNMEEGKEAI